MISRLMLVLIISNVSYGSVTYDLTGGNLSYGGVWASSSPKVEASLSIITEISQTFTTQDDILAFFNSTPFLIKMNTSAGLLTEMNNENSEWSFQKMGNINSTILAVSPDKMTLLFDTDDGSEIFLRLTGLNGNFGSVQFSQVNNVTDYNFIYFGYNAVYYAEESRTYNTPFVFNAVPEPYGHIVTGKQIGRAHV